MSEAIKLFIEDARAVSIEEAAKIMRLTFKRTGVEHPQPCPHCFGTDTFSFNTKKEKWNCRAGGIGGNDAIGMAAHCEGLDVKSREGLLEACSIVLDRDIPEEGERESDEDRAARKKRLEERRLQNDCAFAERAASQDEFRERERQKARGIYQSLTALRTAAQMHGRFYLQYRCGGYPDATWLRVGGDVTYWHGQDERGSPLALYSGLAMVAPFIMPDLAPIGCHITWIDLDRPPKFRPQLVDPTTGELLPTKKMRGSKKGGLIPIAGHPDCSRWVGGEGIENGVAFGVWEGFRADTFYFAAGDLGNLAGPADPSSRFAHPTLKKPDAKGVARPVMVAGPIPKRDQDAADAMWVADHVRELVLLADGDSERVMTAAAMARARARHARPGRIIPIVWPRAGYDFSRMAVETGE
ncbi:P4 alpha zinc-binding domain-containing protein [Mesorhizobium sp. M1142]|uniref:P4 alpha zinc-binding domain-containing protein n=1 Tax=Mesorhizobium sp. M1142 TaxID=2957060 RepID=UPI00333D9E17